MASQEWQHGGYAAPTDYGMGYPQDTQYPAPNPYGKMDAPPPYWQDPNNGRQYGPPTAAYSEPYPKPENHELGTSAPTMAASGIAASSNDDVENTMNNFSETSIRRGFIRKVFAILSIQLIVTFGIMSIFVFSEDAKEFIQDKLWMLIASYITVIVLSIALVCSEKLRRKSPANIICLSVFTLAMSWMLSSTASYFDAQEVLIAVGMCMGVTFIMFLFGLQTKYDFTWMIGPLVSVLFCLVIFGFMCIFMQDRVLNLLYACIGAIVFSLFITVDVQLVVGKGRYALDSEEYILAALNIYLDIVNLLLAILSIMQHSD